MKARDFRIKAEELLKRYNENKIPDSAFDENVECNAIKDEFLHLVFFFNPEIPMLKEMQASSPYPGLTKLDRAPENYMQRFIHYLNEFFPDDNE